MIDLSLICQNITPENWTLKGRIFLQFQQSAYFNNRKCFKRDVCLSSKVHFQPGSGQNGCNSFHRKFGFQDNLCRFWRKIHPLRPHFPWYFGKIRNHGWIEVACPSMNSFAGTSRATDLWKELWVFWKVSWENWFFVALIWLFKYQRGQIASMLWTQSVL